MQYNYNYTLCYRYYFHTAQFLENTTLNGKYSTTWIMHCNIFESLKAVKMILSICFTNKLRQYTLFTELIS